MRRAARQHLLTALLVVAVTSGCAVAEPAGDAGDPGPVAQPAAEQGDLAEEQVYAETFAEPAPDWPDPEAFLDGGGYRLAAGERAEVPYEVPGDALGALVETALTIGVGGAAALACDLGEAGGVVRVVLSSDGRLRVVQEHDGAERVLDETVLPEGSHAEPGEQTVLRLLCSDSPEGLAVAVAAHGGPLRFVPGADGAVPTGPWRLVVSAEQGEPTELAEVAVRLVE